MKNQDLLNGARSPADLFIGTVCAQGMKDLNLPYVLSYSPVSILNPFQKLLYCSATEAGYAIVPTAKFHDLGIVNWKNRSVIHLHWLASVLKNCKSSEHAEFCVREFEKLLVEWRSRGHKLLWTMHNLLPHDHSFTDAEISLREVIIRHSNAIHVLSKDSVELANDIYYVPEHKTFHVPHPSYEGWYPNIVDLATARQYLDLNFKEFVFLAFGSIQRYKGIVELIEAFKILERENRDRSLRLIISGKPADANYMNEIIESIGAGSNINLIPNALEDRDIQVLFNAADVVVAPYSKTLNSGISLLAATFMKELVAPYSPGITQTYAADTTLLYTGKPGDQLVDSLRRSINYKISSVKFSEILKLHNPNVVSKNFFDAITTYVLKTDGENSV